MCIYIYMLYAHVDFSKNRLDGDEVRVRLPFSQAFEDLILPSAVRFWEMPIFWVSWMKMAGDATYGF